MNHTSENIRRRLKRRLRNRQRVSRYCRRLGLLPGIRAYWRLITRKSEPVAVTSPRLAAPLLVRPDTTDPYIFEEVFLLGEYDFHVMSTPKLILDIGANVGYASIYFANRFPDAHVIAVEPERSNIECLHRNTRAYPNIRVVEAGIWSRHTRLTQVDTGAKSSDFQFREVETGDPGIEAVTVDDLLDLAQSNHADIVKIDIEGGERELFAENTEWLDKIDTVAIELHDRFRPGCKDAFLQAVSRHGFNGRQSGLNFIAHRQSQKA